MKNCSFSKSQVLIKLYIASLTEKHASPDVSRRVRRETAVRAIKVHGTTIGGPMAVGKQIVSTTKRKLEIRAGSGPKRAVRFSHDLQ